MTRDELRVKVADALSDLFLGSQELRGFYEDAAEAAIDTIFAALKEPTEEMVRKLYPLNGKRIWRDMIYLSPISKGMEDGQP